VHRSTVNLNVTAYRQRALALNSAHITQDLLSYSAILRRNIPVYYLNFTNLKLCMDNQLRSIVNTVTKFQVFIKAPNLLYN
jgi:hypothetical protein